MNTCGPWAAGRGGLGSFAALVVVVAGLLTALPCRTLLAQTQPPPSPESSSEPSPGCSSRPSAATELDRIAWAAFLRREGDFYRAVSALKEADFLATSWSARRQIQLEIASIYEQAQQWEAAALAYAALASQEPEPRLALDDRRAEARAYMRGERCRDALVTLRRIERTLGAEAADAGAADLQSEVLLRQSLCLAYVGAFAESRALLADIPNGSAWDPVAEQARRSMSQVLPIPYKSPALAGLLSVVPGAGHAYLGAWGSAATALVLTGGLGAATYESIEAKHYVLGALLGSLAALWYAGSIYGAVNLAERHNETLRVEASETLYHSLADRLLAAGPGGPDGVDGPRAEEPWSAHPAHPALVQTTAPERRAEPGGHPVQLIYRVWTGLISPVDGPRCPHTPTCARYAVQAVTSYGTIFGAVLTVDRLLHEGSPLILWPTTTVGDTLRLVDTPADNVSTARHASWTEGASADTH